MKKIITSLILITALGGTVSAQTNSPYKDKGDRYELPITSDIPQGERVEIHKDKAQMDLVGWNDEYRISIKPQMPTTLLGAADKDFKVNAKHTLFSKKIEYKHGDTTAFVEPKSDSEFDIDFTLDSKPDTNIFTYVIEGAEEFDFFYQPELTAEEIAEGANRPDNVIGSYAVYHKTKANHRVGSTNYGTGKAFHIYRPKTIDANGVEVWAELTYVNSILSVEVPQKFLDDAVYPVRVDPTFGYTSAGSSTTFLNSIRCLSSGTAGTITPAENGDVTSITMSVRNGSGVTTYTTVGSLYASSTLGFLKGTNSTDITPSYNDWLENTLTSSQAVVAGTTYIICAWASNFNVTIEFDSTGTYQLLTDVGTYPTWEDPLTPASQSQDSLSIYATYTADEEPPASVPESATSTVHINNGRMDINNGRVIQKR